ncbi:MAG: hypothetical protein PEPC_01370 [Peptostreptococcus russellii]
MKKQIAVLMAAATAVTTVAPAVANAVDVTKNDASVTEVVSKVRKALDDRYSDKGADGIREPQRNKVEDYLNSKYAILVNVEPNWTVKEDEVYKDQFESEKAELNSELKLDKNAEWYAIDDADKLGTLLEENKTKNPKVAIIDKGHDGDKSTRETKYKHYVSEVKDGDYETLLSTDIERIFKDAKSSGGKTETYVQTLKVDGVEVVSGKNQVTDHGVDFTKARKAELTFVSGEKVTLEINGDAFDINKARDKNGNKIDLSEGIENSKTVLESVTKFDKIDNLKKESREVDIPNADEVEAFEINAEQIVKEINLKDLYTKEDGYSEKGADMVNDYRELLRDGGRFNMDGVNYIVAKGDIQNVKDVKIDKDKDSYKFKFTVKAELADDRGEYKNIKFIVRSDSQGDLITVRDDMANAEGEDAVSGRFTKLAGSNRYNTAIEVSKEQFDDDDSADTVVIVGGKAQMDGLSAAPLASAKNAPVLLADPNTGLSNATIKEIDRVTKDLHKKIVYIVGGEKSVPASVEKQLKDEFNCSIVRLSGNDRLSTSLSVAKRLVNDSDVNKNDANIYLVGRDGAADAMSISAVASDKKRDSDKVSPILVVDSKGIERSTRDYIQDRMDIKNAYLIGGNKSLSTDVYDDAKKLNKTEITPQRISGANRYETNVSVVKKFYADPKAGAVFFASGEDQYLVDAQTSGVLAADKKAPLVLTGNKLTDNQVKLMNDGELLEKANAGKDVYQIGGVVSSDVMKVVVDKLDL